MIHMKSSLTSCESRTLALDSWTLHLLQKTETFFTEKRQQAFLVGGAVRNALLDIPCTDWDIATTGNAPELARQLSSRLGGSYANMNVKAGRITCKHEGCQHIFDIAPLQGNTIEHDLRQRDFTLNAIAVPLASAVRHFATHDPLSLIDPLHGADDLRTHCLRAVNDTVFKHDTLRLLRAVRLIIRYDLTPDEHTQHMLHRDAPFLLLAAPERIHMELYAILERDGATDHLRLLDQYGLLTTLMPELLPARGMEQPGLHNWDVFDHSLETVAALERLAHALQQAPDELQASPLNDEQGDLTEIQALLREAEQQKCFQFATLLSPAMKMAALLHDIGKTVTQATSEDGKISFYGHPQMGIPLAQAIARRVNMSTQDQRLVRQVVANHMRPGQLSRDPLTQRAVRRYFVDLGPAGILVALVSLADHLAMRGPQELTDAWTHHLATVRLLLTRYIREREVILPPHLLQGEELMRKFHVPPGPLVGQLLDAIAEARADGKIHSKDDAFWFVEERLHHE